MIKSYLLITFRSLFKNKVFVLINVFGMGIAIACCIVGRLAYQYDTTFDGIHSQGSTIYRVGSIRKFENSSQHFGYSPLPLGEIMSKTMSEVERSTGYYHSWSNFKRENDLFPANLSYVHPDFFRMFSFDFIAGNPSDLSSKANVFVSEDMAVRLFRTPLEALGKTITQVYGTELKEIKVAGVFRDPPMNSSFYRKDGSAYMNFENRKDEHPSVHENDWKELTTWFVQLPNLSSVHVVHGRLQPYIENNNRVREDFQISEYVLDRFAGMARIDRADDVRAATWVAPPASAIIGSMIMGLLILLLAAFNLTNTAIAISSRRLNEIGIRKVMGGMRMQLIIQFIGETTFVCFLALLVGVALADVLIAGWNSLWEDMRISHHFLDSAEFVLFLVAVLLITGIVAGSYPAFYISKFDPVKILKGRVKFGGTNYFTRVLLGLQFAISLIAVVSAIGFLQNARYQRDYDLGFDIRGSVVAWINNRGEFDTYRNALQSNPKIISMAGAKSGIFAGVQREPVKFESRQAEVGIIEVGDNYLETMNLKLLSGRDFIRDSRTDIVESIIITRKMADLFGWEKPLGKQLLWKDTVKLYVIGVIKDVYTQGLWRELEPMMIRYIAPEKYNQIVVSATAEDVPGVNTFMNQQWQTVFPNRLYNGNMLVTDLRKVNEVNLNIVYMYLFLGIIALTLSATGLFTLVSLNIIRRMKEIGVRKVLGASVANIARVVNMEFAIILLAGSVLGSWAGLSASNALMASIWRYYQGIDTLTVILSVGLLIVISVATVGYKVISVAMMNPVNSLRDE